MKNKMKAVLLLTMFVIASVLLMVPSKPVQANLVVLNGDLTEVNGLVCCACPGNEDRCGCGVLIRDL